MKKLYPVNLLIKELDTTIGKLNFISKEKGIAGCLLVFSNKAKAKKWAKLMGTDISLVITIKEK